MYRYHLYRVSLPFLASLLSTVPKHNCPSSPIPHWPALTLVCLHPGQSMVTSFTYVITVKEKNKENITLLTFLWFILCPFGHRQPSHIPDFLIMQLDVIHMIILHFYVSQPCSCLCMNINRAEVHLFHPCQVQESVWKDTSFPVLHDCTGKFSIWPLKWTSVSTFLL